MPSLESYTADEIPNLKRRELQNLCKTNGIKANSKSTLLIKQLQKKLRKALTQKAEGEKAINKENQSETANENSNSQNNTNNVQNESVAEISALITPQKEENQENEEDHISQIAKHVESQQIPEASAYDDGHSNYNANPNGNNGSFVDIEPEASPTESSELDEALVDFNTSSDNQEMYTTHNSVNNGSMIKSPIIVERNVENINDLNSSLSLTPKLNRSTQEFIRRSLNPEYKEDTSDDAHDDEDDVAMEITPFNPQQRIVSLQHDIDRMEENELNISNVSLLGMNASRVTVESENTGDLDDLEEHESTASSSGDQEPAWKSTPLKALQILESIQSEISMEASSKSEDKSMNNEEDNVEDLALEISFDISPKSVDQSMDIDHEENTEDLKNEISFESTKSENNPLLQSASKSDEDTVENLFYKSPILTAKKDPLHIVEPKSHVLEEKNVRKVSMQFGDGQVFSFRSVYSPSPSIYVDKNHNKRRKSTSMLKEKASSPEELLCEKTMAIRKMMEEEEEKQSQIDKWEKKQYRKSTVPDWNKIHEEQIFSRQPDLSQWDTNRKQRAGKLFGLSANKMSTPSYRSRSKSMIGAKKWSAKTGHSEKKPNKKRATIAPSSNDHLFNHNGDLRLNKKVIRNPTPYKRNAFDVETQQIIRNKKASKKPRFSVSFGNGKCTESDSISEENVIIVPKNKLAFDPDKVKSRLYENTKSSKKKISNVPKRALTPQIKSDPKKKMFGNKMKKMQKNWSEVKSKIDTNNVRKPNVCGIKRKLSWSINKNQNEVCEPKQKKRRLTTSAIKDINSKK